MGKNCNSPPPVPSTMNFHVISLMPELVQQSLAFGVVGAAFKKKLCHLHLHNPRDFTGDSHRTVDDRPFGGGDGLLMMAEPLHLCLNSIDERGKVIYLSPRGTLFRDSMAKSLSRENQITLICGRYGGVDRRFIMKNRIDEVSIGDYILSGGELAASVLIDAIVRHVPGTLGHSCSATEDSFKDGLLEAPGFTRPRKWRNAWVPGILLSGDHKKIEEYRQMTALVTSLLKRPELLTGRKVSWSQVYAYFQNCEDQDLGFCDETREEILARISHKFS